MGEDFAGHRQRVVIVGAGFAGAYCAAELLRLDRARRLDVTLIDQRNHMIFHPLLVEAGTGALEPRHTVVSIRSMCPGVDFRMARVTGVDLSARRVNIRLQDVDIEQRIDFDHLVLALGSVTRRPGSVPGLGECAFEIKSLADAVNLRDRAIEMLELADAVDDPGLRRELLHWVVVGGNFTGVEVAGEFMAFMQEAAHVYPRLKPSDCTMTLVDRASRILSALD
ncbi:MAG: FAD-dependent oxidoreductase, partial [Phycisphaeraceae bacterium]|nr:FAD-dependent oxidoreductase [Phycisphaeraceae bacterium]